MMKRAVPLAALLSFPLSLSAHGAIISKDVIGLVVSVVVITICVFLAVVVRMGDKAKFSDNIKSTDQNETEVSVKSTEHNPTKSPGSESSTDEK